MTFCDAISNHGARRFLNLTYRMFIVANFQPLQTFDLQQICVLSSCLHHVFVHKSCSFHSFVHNQVKDAVLRGSKPFIITILMWGDANARALKNNP